MDDLYSILKELSDPFHGLFGTFKKPRSVEPFEIQKTFQVLCTRGKIKERGIKAFTNDMKNAVLYFLSNGTKLKYTPRIVWGSNFSYMKELIERYQIIDTIPKKSKDVTLARIANTFPFLACYLLKEGFGRIKGDRLDLARPLAWTGAPGIIPKEYTEAFTKWQTWSKSFEKAIKLSDSDPKYAKIGLNSNWLTQDEKKEILKVYGVASDGTQVLKTTSKPQDKCLVEEFGFQYFGDETDELCTKMMTSLLKKFTIKN